MTCAVFAGDAVVVMIAVAAGCVDASDIDCCRVMTIFLNDRCDHSCHCDDLSQPLLVSVLTTFVHEVFQFGQLVHLELQLLLWPRMKRLMLLNEPMKNK